MTMGKRLIDADALLELFPDEIDGLQTYNAEVQAIINSQPTILLIPCVDCKYWDVSKSNIMNHTCHWGYFLKKEDDYCSWAKPKEEESE